MRIVFIAGLGGAIGSFIGLQFGHTWWAGALGLLAGALFAYVFVDWNSFASGCAQAFREVTRKRKPISREQWLIVGWAIAAAFSLWLTLFLAMIAMAVSASTLTFIPLLKVCASFSLIMVVVMSILVSGILYGTAEARKANTLRQPHKYLREMAILFSPPSIIWHAVLWGYKGAVATPGVVVKIARFIADLVTTTYQHTVTNARLCALLGGGTGALAGWYFGNPLIGFIVGGAIGFMLALLHRQAVKAKS